MSCGIRFGTSTACIAICKNPKETPEVASNPSGERLNPTALALSENEILVGSIAQQLYCKQPAGCILELKQLVGQSLPSQSVKEYREKYPSVQLFENEGELCVNEKQFTVTRLLAELFATLKQTADHKAGNPVDHCVIAVPIGFTDAAIQTLTDAARHAGFEVLRVIHEPAAVIVAQGLTDKQSAQSSSSPLYLPHQSVGIVHLGSSSLQLVEADLHYGIASITSHQTIQSIRGAELDSILREYFAKEFDTKYYTNIKENGRSMRTLLANCEKLKQQLSIGQSARLHIEALHEGCDFNSSLSRPKFESIADGFFTRVQDALSKWKGSKNFDKIVVSGGSFRIPKLRSLVESTFRQSTFLAHAEPDVVIAEGAALQASLLYSTTDMETHDDSPTTEVDVAPHSLGVKLPDGQVSVLIHAGTPLPTKTTTICKTTTNRISVQICEVHEKKEDSVVIVQLGMEDVSPETQLLLTLELNEDGRLKASLLDATRRKLEEAVVFPDEQ